MLPLSNVGKSHTLVSSSGCPQPLIRAHAAAVQDVAFSPHQRDLLFSCGTDGAKLWTVPEGGFLVDQSEATATYSPSFSGASRALAMHLSARDVFAVRGSKEVSLFDVSTGTERLSIAASCLGDSELQSMSWSFLGNQLVMASKDRSLRLVDPRSASAVSSFSGIHSVARNLRASWLGDSHYLLSTGIGTTQQRELALWDSRMAGAAEPVRRERLDGGRGPMQPYFDPDSGLLLLLGRGDVTMKVFEFDMAKCSLFSISSVNIGEPIRGAALLPKQTNDLMACEVLRVLKLADGCVQPISLTVPRRERLRFHADLFPPTTSEAPPSMSASEWLDGANNAPLVVALLPPSYSSSEPVTVPEEVKPAAAAPTEKDKMENASRVISVSRLSMSFGSFAGSSRFKHLFGKESARNASYFNLRPAAGSSESPMIACSERFWAIPWMGTGGPVYVSRIDGFGKVEPSTALIDGHRGAVQDLAFSPFHPDLLVTAGDDCKVNLWRIPEEGLQERSVGLGDELCSLSSHTHSVRTCNFHPTVAGCLVTSSYDMTVRIFDVDAGASREICSIQTGLGDLGSSISNLAFNYDGSLFAAASRDRAVRIYDIRSRVAAVGSIDKGQGLFSPSTGPIALGRNLRVAWCASPSLNVILTTSAALSTGQRQVILWDPRKLDEPITVRAVDNASGALYPVFDPDTSMCFLSGRGDTTIRYYDISAGDDAPAACTLLSQHQGAGGSAPITGVCFLPKRVCQTREVEVARALKLAGDTVTSVGFFLPRADHLKEFFQDDVFPPTQTRPTLTCASWATDPFQSSEPVLESLKPKDMAELSTRRESLVGAGMALGRSKLQSFEEERLAQEEECRQKDAALNKLKQLALQRAAYDASAKRAVDDGDSSDGGWDN